MAWDVDLEIDRHDELSEYLRDENSLKKLNNVQELRKFGEILK
jgi:hypothetical protein